MAIINWITAKGYVIVAITGFGADMPDALPNINVGDLDGPTTQNAGGGVERWNYGIPKHSIEEDDVKLLIEWFEGQYRGRGLRAQAKGYGGGYGGFVVNLVWDLYRDAHNRRRRFNFHIKIEEASMTMGTLASSGASEAQAKSAMDKMFPPLGSQ